MGQYEVTQKEYQEVMGSNPSTFSGSQNRPVENVSWVEAAAYCEALSQRERAAGRIPTNCVFRLPTEAEWEYACRAWTSSRFNYGEDPGAIQLANYAWYGPNSGGTTQPVGQKIPNLWGLYDMYGNVSEWCQDQYGDTLPGGVAIDPEGPVSTTPYRVLRGGSWLFDDSAYCRSAERDYNHSSYGFSNYGFRVVLTAGQP